MEIDEPASYRLNGLLVMLVVETFMLRDIFVDQGETLSTISSTGGYRGVLAGAFLISLIISSFASPPLHSSMRAAKDFRLRCRTIDRPNLGRNIKVRGAAPLDKSHFGDAIV